MTSERYFFTQVHMSVVLPLEETLLLAVLAFADLQELMGSKDFPAERHELWFNLLRIIHGVPHDLDKLEVYERGLLKIPKPEDLEALERMPTTLDQVDHLRTVVCAVRCFYREVETEHRRRVRHGIASLPPPTDEELTALDAWVEGHYKKLSTPPPSSTP